MQCINGVFDIQAAFFACTYCPEKLEEALEQWKQSMN